MHRVWISMETWSRKQEGDVGKKKAPGIQDTVISECKGPGWGWGMRKGGVVLHLQVLTASQRSVLSVQGAEKQLQESQLQRVAV